MPNAIVSVYDKTDLELVGKTLKSFGFNIFATSGTLKYLETKQIQARPIEEYCLNPDGFSDYFSSLSFNTLVGVLSGENRQFANSVIKKIDVVIYNFVPSWEIIKKSQDFNIKNVDLGGPAIVRAAAINYLKTIPVVSPSQYPLLEKLFDMDTTTRKRLAQEAFDYCSWYDHKLSCLLKSL